LPLYGRGGNSVNIAFRVPDRRYIALRGAISSFYGSPAPKRLRSGQRRTPHCARARRASRAHPSPRRQGQAKETKAQKANRPRIAGGVSGRSGIRPARGLIPGSILRQHEAMSSIDAIVEELKLLPPERLEQAAAYVHGLRQTSQAERL